jgi:hypothetical protein
MRAVTPDTNSAKSKFRVARGSLALRASPARNLGLFSCHGKQSVGRRKPAVDGHSLNESQRDSATKPRVARHELLPWLYGAKTNNPNGVAAAQHVFAGDETPLGFCLFCPVTQGSSSLATLGFRTQSLRDWHTFL